MILEDTASRCLSSATERSETRVAPNAVAVARGARSMVLLGALLLSASAMHWGHAQGVADTGSGPIWRQVLAVPLMYRNDEVFGSGRMLLEEIVAKLDVKSDQREAAKLIVDR